MRDLFPGYYDLKNEELDTLWQEGIFIFDTNMLLHVYEYSPATRDRFFEILYKLKDRIWIPHQVASEYQKGRIRTIIKQKNSYKFALKQLDKTLQSLKDDFELYKKDKHAFIDAEEFIDKITQEITNAKTKIHKAASKHPDYKTTDPLREKLEELFANRIGDSYNNETYKKKYEEAQYRLENKIPPGFKDEGKKDLGRYGDTIIWFQIIDHASLKKRPIIFISDDTKKDWWIPQEESYSKRKPHPELIQEIYLETGMLFHMYEGYDFMDEAQIFLKLEAKPEVIEEIKEVGQRDTVDLPRIQQEWKVLRAIGDVMQTQPSSQLPTIAALLPFLQNSYSEEEIIDVLDWFDESGMLKLYKFFGDPKGWSFQLTPRGKRALALSEEQ